MKNSNDRTSNSGKQGNSLQDRGNQQQLNVQNQGRDLQSGSKSGSSRGQGQSSVTGSSGIDQQKSKGKL